MSKECLATLFAESRNPSSRLHCLCDDLLIVIGAWVLIDYLQCDLDGWEKLASCKTPFLHGIASSGKSTLCNLLTKLYSPSPPFNLSSHLSSHEAIFSLTECPSGEYVQTAVPAVTKAATVEMKKRAAMAQRLMRKRQQR